MKSFFGRGASPTTKASGAKRRRLTLVLALCVSMIAGLAFSVAALAASTPIPMPTGTTGTTSVTTGTDLPTDGSAYNAAWAGAPADYTAPSNDGLGVSSGQIGHVWDIVLENHAFDANFTPLRARRTPTRRALPSQGALLTNYYGTGHSSLDNYISMASGQAPQADDQDDCPSYDAMTGSVDTSGTPATNSDYGQFESSAGPDAPPNDNGCVYPSTVPTIFNQWMRPARPGRFTRRI